MKTGFIYDDRFLDHNTHPEHPECPQRLVATMQHLLQQPWFSKLTQLTPQDAAESWIHEIHERTYVQHVKQVCQSGAETLDSPDVGISPPSFDIARLATGAGLALADAMMAGEIQNGFALVRPPGHHAESTSAMGFCLFNNIAILARYLQKQHGLERILILDWDVHHGNGTQHSFTSDGSVFYMSLHQYPFYPGSGSLHETGDGKGKGKTLNCPMRRGAGNEAYLEAFRTQIIPKAKAFRPDVILISAGFDAHVDDPLGGIELTNASFKWMTEEVLALADQYAKGRVISLLEGGYNLAALPACVAQHLRALLSLH